MVYKHQSEYYKAINANSGIGESTPFIEFMKRKLIASKTMKEISLLVGLCNF